MHVHPLLFFPLSLAIGASVYASPYTFSMSGDTTQFDYAETNSAGLLDTETNQFGDISGFSVNLEPKYEGFYLGGSYAQGRTDYIGGTLDNPTYGSHLTTTQNQIMDTCFGYKTTIVADNGTTEIPIKFGLGYRGWLRELQSTATVSGYDELYEWGYYDLGIGLHTKFSRDITFGIDANYRWAFNPQMYENYYGTTFKLNNVYGYKIAIPLEIALNHSWNAFFIYTYEYWNIGASDRVNVGIYQLYEPDSETKNQTLSIGLSYRF